jgi:hypothetical protein
MNFNKKAQAAMEFLTTYGWMFLLIIVIMGGLWQFGVFSPSTWVSSSCQLDNKIACPSFSFTQDQENYTFLLELQNFLSQPITINKTRITNQEETMVCLADVKPLDDSQTNQLSTQGINQKKDFKIIFNSSTPNNACDVLLQEALDSKRRFIINIYYSSGTSTLLEVSSGRLITEIISLE